MCGTIPSGYPRHQWCTCQIAFRSYSITIARFPWGICCQIMLYFPPSVLGGFYSLIRCYFPSLCCSGMSLQGANMLLHHSCFFWEEAAICKLATNCAPVLTGSVCWPGGQGLFKHKCLICLLWDLLLWVWSVLKYQIYMLDFSSVCWILKWM